MKKFYSLLLLVLIGLGISFRASADITVKVNKTGVVTIDRNGSVNTLNEAESTYAFPLIAAFEVPSGTTIKVTNETTGTVIGSNATRVDVHPGNTLDGHTINIEVSGSGAVVDEQFVTFVFSPAGSGYVVTTRDNGGVMVEDKVYTPAAGSDEVLVPYDISNSYLIKPNTGYALQNAKDETQTSNPHYTGLPANPTDGFIHGDMTSLSAGSIVVVTAVQSGSFSVMGVGTNIENIVMTNLKDYSELTVTDVPQTVDFVGGTEYKIFGNPRLWKIDITDAEGYTYSLTGQSGNFWYTPTAGDKVVIYTDMPEQHAKVHISFEGDGVDAGIVDKVLYGNELIDKAVWSAAEWDVLAGGTVRIYFNETGFTDLSCTLNGEAVDITKNYQETNRYAELVLDNGDEIDVEYEIVIAAEKEKQCAVTFECAAPEAVVICTNVNWVLGDPLDFTTSGQKFTFTAGTGLRIAAANGWILDGILLNGKEPASGVFVDGYITINNDCTITMNVTDRAELRTKTVVVYVDETVENPAFLSLKFSGEQESQDIKPGYNFVKFGDIDLPMSFGYNVENGNDPTYFVNGEKVTTPEPCPQTISLADGSVIKYFHGLPVQQVVTYNIAEDVAELIQINHDYTVVADHTTTTQYALHKGTQIHIKVVEAEAASRAENEAPIVVKVDGNEIQPDADGLYGVKVGDTAPTIAITKAASGLDDILSEGNETFTIYNLQGMAVKSNATAADFNTLPAGVYIANGKKVLVK